MGWFQECRDAGLDLTVCGAFSHDDPDHFETVTDVFARNPRVVYDGVRSKKTHVYYCGPAFANIPAKVEEGIVKAIATAGSIDMQAAWDHILSIKAEGHYMTEAAN
eukprot:NODE_1937_length_527_cov_864.387029_g1576_i0.p2 GENE.NODE_1937_length_527_cov_864.387029_g1576_i0~~NODE_1937_length_527_cov_864.387029_g1576_i0.p2  ORF type:complete len:113 (-),score=27.34 NODE_1937_length_527_cov_864.387029_g1576_i0:189-506(-)